MAQAHDAGAYGLGGGEEGVVGHVDGHLGVDVEAVGTDLVQSPSKVLLKVSPRG